ncbi:MAG: hypothetical protein ACPG32_01475 [Akkermansiaceae bacterium]
MKMIKHLALWPAIALIACSCVPTPGSDAPSSPASGGVHAPVPEATKNYPVAHPHPEGKANYVVSPYRPYNVIDVKGYRSGDIVGDPSTAKVNPTTGKIDASTAKHFRIP